MALTEKETRFISQMQQKAAQLVALADELATMRCTWDQDDLYNQIGNDELTAFPEYAHLTVAELGNCFAAFDAVRAALGDKVSGQVVNLIKVLP